MRLAVDGGATGLRMTVVDSGESVDIPGFQWTAEGNQLEQQRERVVRAWEELGKPTPVEVIALGLAGAGSDPESRRLLAPRIAESLGAEKVLLTGDDVTNHLGVLGGEPGVAIAVGTGVACLAVTTDGRLANIDGMGYLFGDRGGGFSIGLAGLRAVLEAVEGVGPQSLLVEPAARVLDSPVRELPRAIRTWYYKPRLVADVAAFATNVTALADRDEVAREICRNAGRALAGSVRAAATNFGSVGSATQRAEVVAPYDEDGSAPQESGTVPVSWSGSVLRSPVILESFTASLPDHVSLREPAGDAMAGAVRLALEPEVPHLAGVVVHDRSSRAPSDQTR